MLLYDVYKPYLGRKLDVHSRIMGYENKLWSQLLVRDIMKSSDSNIMKSSDSKVTTCPICLEEGCLDKKCLQCNTLFHKECSRSCDTCPVCRYKHFN